MRKEKILKLFYDPESKVPLIWPLPLLAIGHCMADGIHLLMRIWVHGNIYFASFGNLPALTYTDGTIHYHAWVLLMRIGIVLASLSLLASAFSFKSWFVRIPYILIVSILGWILVFLIELWYRDLTGINWK